ncbi:MULTISPECIES: GPP34 family phosphoprotein [unclassified Micromonospora]|uniref:GOLPH3/VPS74 family protein n=1 Tax=unclassified Micromonospora TaxID=2617518 RepID=UPI0010349390|nr:MULTISPECIES: GPP34 family phosphoprotein [unclassified Micromonospora]QKW13656.1 GPP34 family phosphoprotein [Verrucosispora sp. NA02020]TBL45550.1 GPP34 family phosphoprotein [Verrucosispora sp. SN26_14.1]
MTIDSWKPSDPPTLTEDLLLLLFQPRSGTIAGENTLFYVLAGAVLADLALNGQLATTAKGRISSVAEHVPSDDVLRATWDYLADKPRSAQTVLAAMGPGLRQPVLDRLVRRGDIRQEERKVLGLFRSTALRDGGTDRRARLLDDVRQVLVEGAEPSARIAALAALLSASGTLPQFDREIPWTSPVITRAKELEQGDWGATAAAEAVTRTVTATVVNSTVAAITVLPRS